MRVNKKTIELAKIRRLIRKAIKWYEKDKGMPNFWKCENYVNTCKASRFESRFGVYPYYTRSDRAIEDVAIKIYDLLRKRKHGKL